MKVTLLLIYNLRLLNIYNHYICSNDFFKQMTNFKWSKYVLNIDFISVINVDGNTFFNKCFTHFCNQSQFHPSALSSYFKFILKIYPKISNQAQSGIHKINFGNFPLFYRRTANQKQIICLGLGSRGNLKTHDKARLVEIFDLFEEKINRYIRRKIEKEAFKQIVEKFTKSIGKKELANTIS